MAYSGHELIGIGKQSALGTAATTYANVVTDGSFSATENVTAINQKGRRGFSEAMDFNQYYGRGSTDISFGGAVELQQTTSETRGSILGILLRNILGSGPVGTTAASSGIYKVATNSTTTADYWFRLARNAKEYLTVAQRLTAESTGDKQVKDARVTNITITADPESVLSYTATLIGQPATIGSADGEGVTLAENTTTFVPMKEPNTFSGLELGASTATSAAIGQIGEASHVKAGLVLPDGAGSFINLSGTGGGVLSCEWSFTREATPVYTMDTKTAVNRGQYNDILLGPLEVTCSFVFYAKKNITQIFRGQGNGAVFNSCQKGTANSVSERGVTIGARKVSFAEGGMEIDSSATYATIALSGRALWTDSTTSNATSAPLSNTAYTSGTPVEVQLTEAGTSIAYDVA